MNRKSKIIIASLSIIFSVILVSALVTQQLTFSTKAYDELSKKTITLGVVEKKGSNCFYNETIDGKSQFKMFKCDNITTEKAIVDLRNVKAVQYLEWKYGERNNSQSKSGTTYGETTLVIPTAKQ